MERPDQNLHEMPKPSKSIGLSIFTWGLLACLALTLLAPLAGLRMQSLTGYMAGHTSTQEPIPTLSETSRQPLPGMVVSIWLLPEPTYVASDQLSAQEVLRGTDSDGSVVYTFAYTEQGFNDYLYYWYLTVVQPEMPALRSPHVDVKSGALMFYCDIDIAGVSERIGFLYEIDAQNPQVHFRGMERSGQLLLVGEGSFLDQQGLFVENLANRALREMTFLDDSSAKLTIQQIYLDEDRLEIMASSEGNSQ